MRRSQNAARAVAAPTGLIGRVSTAAAQALSRAGPGRPALAIAEPTPSVVLQAPAPLEDGVNPDVGLAVVDRLAAVLALGLVVLEAQGVAEATGVRQRIVDAAVARESEAADAIVDCLALLGE